MNTLLLCLNFGWITDDRMTAYCAKFGREAVLPYMFESDDVSVKEKSPYCTYIIINETSGLIKIGRTAQTIEERIAELKRTHKGNYRILREYDFDIEGPLLHMFRKFIVIGEEWLDIGEKELMAQIASLQISDKKDDLIAFGEGLMLE